MCFFTGQLNAFFVFELLDAKMYKGEDLTQFEGEVRADMLRYFPDCHPMLVSSQTGRDVFKPGNLISQYSKLYISRFESQRDIDRIWRSGNNTFTIIVHILSVHSEIMFKLSSTSSGKSVIPFFCMLFPFYVSSFDISFLTMFKIVYHN